MKKLSLREIKYLCLDHTFLQSERPGSAAAPVLPPHSPASPSKGTEKDGEHLPQAPYASTTSRQFLSLTHEQGERTVTFFEALCCSVLPVGAS